MRAFTCGWQPRLLADLIFSIWWQGRLKYSKTGRWATWRLISTEERTGHVLPSLLEHLSHNSHFAGGLDQRWMNWQNVRSSAEKPGRNGLCWLRTQVCHYVRGSDSQENKDWSLVTGMPTLHIQTVINKEGGTGHSSQM
jgi:hypothetical protein